MIGVGPVPVDITPTVAGMALAAIATVAVALTTLSVRVGTAEGGTADALFVVVLINAAVFVPIAGLLYFPDYGLTLRALGAFVAAGLVATLLARSLTFVSFRRIGASRTEPIRSAHPLSATIVAVLVLSETVGPLHMVGIGLVVAGVVLVSWESARGGAETPMDGSSLQLLIPMGAAFLYGLEPTLAKLGLAEGTPALVGLSVKTLAALVVLAAFLAVREDLSGPLSPGRLSRRWLLLAGGLNTAFLFFYYAALELAPVTFVVPIVSTSPIVVVVLSRLFLPRLERVTPRLVAAAGVVVVGVIAVALSG